MKPNDHTRHGGTADAPAGGGVRGATGRDRNEWFAVLDAWGAAGRAYREVADWLTGGHGLSSWWAQKLIVEYEQARGLRQPGSRRDGTFTVTASKTVAVPVERVRQAFSDSHLRGRWLPGVALRERAAQRPDSARFDWDGGATRITVHFDGRGQAKSQVAVEPEKLPDARAADETRAYWRERLAALKGGAGGLMEAAGHRDPSARTDPRPRRSEG